MPTFLSFDYSDNRGVLGCSINVTARGSNKTFIYTLRQNAAQRSSVSGFDIIPFDALDFVKGLPAVIDVSAQCFDAKFNNSRIVTTSINVIGK